VTKFKTTPRPQQLTALELSEGQDAFAYFMTMRTGKTKVTFDDAARAWRNKEIDCLLVLAPNGVQRQWVGEDGVEKHYPEKYKAAYYSGGLKAKERRAFNTLLSETNDSSYLKILTLNIESCSNAKGVKILNQIVRRNRCMIAIDESTRIKTPTATRTKFAVKLGREGKMRRLLNGTPITQSPLDLYSQFQFLDPNIIGMSTFVSFRSRYAIIQRVLKTVGEHKFYANCEKKGIDPCTVDLDKLTHAQLNRAGIRPGKDMYEHIVDYKNLAELEAKISPFTYRLERKDVEGLPPIVSYVRDVEMRPDQRRIYKELETNACAHLGIAPTDLLAFFMDENKVEASNGLVKLLKAQQVLGGHVKNQEGELQYIQHNRITVLLDILDDIQGKVIIWSRFQPEIQEIVSTLQNKFGREAVTEFHGKVKQADRDPNKKRFQTDPKTLYLVGQPAAGGVGQTFDAADTIINYSSDYSLYVRLQSIERATEYEGNDIALIDMICPGTIDAKILDALKVKEKRADEFNYDRED